MKSITNNYLIFAGTSNQGRSTLGISLIEFISYKIILIRSADSNPWLMDTSLTRMTLSAVQASDEQWSTHFEVSNASKLQQLFIEKGNAVNKDDILNIIQNPKEETEKGFGSEKRKYILGESRPGREFHPCSIELEENIKYSLSIGEGGKEWGGSGATISFDDVTGGRFEHIFNEYKADSFVELFRKKGRGISKQDILDFARKIS